MRKITVGIVLLLGCIFLLGCATTSATPVTLRDYKPVNPEEAAIISVLISFEESFNQADQKKLSSILADEAKMMHGRDRKILTKEELAKILPQRIKEMGVIKFSNPRIDRNRDAATVEADYESRVAVLAYSFTMKKVGGKWLIFSTSF